VQYTLELRRGEASASFVMDHGRVGPQGVMGGSDGLPNSVCVIRDGEEYIPEHLSKDQGIRLKPGDRVKVGTPGGGGYGNPEQRQVSEIKSDVANGYYTPQQIKDEFGVKL